MNLLCRIATATGIDRLHAWNRPYKYGPFRSTRRRCRSCRVTQEWQLPGGGWKTVAPARKSRRLHPVTQAQEDQLDRRRGLEPL